MLITRNQVSLNEESFIKRSPFTHGTNGLTFPEYQQNQPWSLVDNVCSPNYDNRKTDDFRSKLKGSGQYWHVISENTWKCGWSLDTRVVCDMESKTWNHDLTSWFVFFFLFLSLVVQTMFILMQVHVQRNFANDVMECQRLTTYKRTMRSK